MSSDYDLGNGVAVEQWDEVEISGSLEARNCTLTYRLAGRALAVATVGQDLRNLQAEAALETQHLAVEAQAC